MPNGTTTFVGSCFQSTTVQLSMAGNVGTLTFTVSNASSAACSDVYLLTTNFFTRFIEMSTASSKREMVISDWKPNEMVGCSRRCWRLEWWLPMLGGGGGPP
jgi:hypothetical protein